VILLEVGTGSQCDLEIILRGCFKGHYKDPNVEWNISTIEDVVEGYRYAFLRRLVESIDKK